MLCLTKLKKKMTKRSRERNKAKQFTLFCERLYKAHPSAESAAIVLLQNLVKIGRKSIKVETKENHE